MPKKSSKEYQIKISPTKGRPMLNWVGKKPLDYVKGYPAVLMEVFDPLKTNLEYDVPRYENLEKNWQNLLFYGDNKDVLATLLEQGFRGKIDLIYIDPPFMSGADYVRRVELRGLKETKTDVDDADLLQQTMYFDMWRNDTYLQFMYERLIFEKPIQYILFFLVSIILSIIVLVIDGRLQMFILSERELLGARKNEK